MVLASFSLAAAPAGDPAAQQMMRFSPRTGMRESLSRLMSKGPLIAGLLTEDQTTVNFSLDSL
jgi:hypothetical protein